MMAHILDRYVAFDTETTGLGPDARIVEFAAVWFCKGTPVGHLTTLLNPGDIDWGSDEVVGALTVNGLTREQLQDAPTWDDMSNAIAHVMTGGAWVAHNATFDIRMVRQEETRAHPEGYSPTSNLLQNGPVLDTMLLDFSLVQGFLKRKLDVVSERWGVPRPAGHRSLYDSLQCGLVLAAMMQGRPINGVM